MHRLFCQSCEISEGKIIIADKSKAHHLKDVLRLRQNDKVSVCDEKGNVYDCIIRDLSGAVELDIKEKHSASLKKGPTLTIACAIPKKAKFDEIVDKLTQIGVDKIVPIETERVIVRWDSQKKALQKKRWEKIAFSAAEQSQRNNLPIIEEIKDIRQVFEGSGNYDLKLIPALIGRRRSLKEVLRKSKSKSILVLIGPEGDFSQQEIELAKKAGFIPVTLGSQVLRVDTAAVAIASFIRLYGDH